MQQHRQPARVRFAPSPTGRFHLGGARTALYDFLLARQSGGQFILRLEDTDQKRFVPGAEQELMDGLRWLGLQWDEGPDIGGPYAPYRQSERKEIYLHHAQRLVESGHAYYCFCSPERLETVRRAQVQRKENPRYDGFCRRLDPEEARRRVEAGEPHVIRFKTPTEGVTVARDLVRGEISVQNSQLDDIILIKSDGLAVYHLAAMVDDHLMGITHVLRGAEWLPTFPLHVQIVRAFGWKEPEWIHLPLFLKPSGKGKMSKRDSAELMQDGYSIYISDLKELGYLPQAVVNWIALMGWSYDDHSEFFTMEDLIEKFNLARLNPSPAAINFGKLDHFNGLHIRSMSQEALARELLPYYHQQGFEVDFEKLTRLVPLIQERIVTLDEAPQWTGFFFTDTVQIQLQELIGKDMDLSTSHNALKCAIELLQRLPEWTKEATEEEMRRLAERLNLKAGQLFGVLRMAITGQKVSPPLFESMEVLGKEAVMQRLRLAEHLLGSSGD